MSKKEIDKLFQEKFENFTDTPTNQVWNSIEHSLDKKKKRRTIIPIWWQLGGIAAVLAVGFLVFNPSNSGLDSESIIVDTENENSKIENNHPIDKQNKNTLDAGNNTILVESSGGEVTTSTSNEISNQSILEKNQNIVSSEGKTKLKTNELTNIAKAASAKIAEVNDLPSKNAEVNKNTSIKSFVATSKSDVAFNAKQNALSTDQVISTDKSESLEQAVAEVEESNKKSIYDEIAAQDEENLVAESDAKKWSVGPSIAPVYFNGLGDGSPVHDMFVANTKSGNVNMSYGVAVSYGISDKLSVKTGVHKVDFGYNTNDVEFSSSLGEAGNNRLSNIDFSNASRNIQVNSNVGNSQEFAADTKSIEFVAKSASFNGAMSQQFEYVEIPIELNYALLDNKFGLNLIGGFSSLFLIDNAITLSSGNLTTEVGSANNVNNVNFSTNVGVGFNYKFSKSIQLNIEPMFKYQLNTFSNTAGDFQPFTLGVYSGLNFRF